MPLVTYARLTVLVCTRERVHPRDDALNAAGLDRKRRVAFVDKDLTRERDRRISDKEVEIRLKTVYPDGGGAEVAKEKKLRIYFDEEKILKEYQQKKANKMKVAMDKNREFGKSWSEAAGEKYKKMKLYLAKPANKADQVATWAGKKMGKLTAMKEEAYKKYSDAKARVGGVYATYKAKSDKYTDDEADKEWKNYEKGRKDAAAQVAEHEKKQKAKKNTAMEHFKSFFVSAHAVLNFQHVLRCVWGICDT